MKFKLETIGCQMNISESDNIAKNLIDFGALRTQEFNDADLIILNTCSVRAQAEQKAFSFIGRAQEIKKKNPNIKIVVIGCMAERLGAKIQKRFKSIDLIIGSLGSKNAAEKILKLFPQEKSQNKTDNSKAKPSVYISIMQGCNNFCSYCIVPFVRGAVECVPTDKIIEQCIRQSDNGAKEVILLGQNVNSYLYNNVSFADLLEKISKISAIKRIRFMTNHPKDLKIELIDIISSIPKICRHLHLPLQSASNKILKLMNRGYSYEDYFQLVKLLREKISGISITSDIITGFPSETEKDFEETLQALSDLKFDGAFIFKYSPRPNTKSYLIKDDVCLQEKKRRHSLCLQKTNEISAQNASRMLGTKEEVLAQNYLNGILETRTLNNRKVFVRGDEKLLGAIFDVKIKEVKVNAMLGEIIGKEIAEDGLH